MCKTQTQTLYSIHRAIYTHNHNIHSISSSLYVNWKQHIKYVESTHYHENTQLQIQNVGGETQYTFLQGPYFCIKEPHTPAGSETKHEVCIHTTHILL